MLDRLLISIAEGVEVDLESETELSNLKKKQITMTGGTPPGQTISLKDSLVVVPVFDISNLPLSVFFEGCDEAKEMVGAESESNLVKLIRSKLQGEARKSALGQKFDTVDK